MLFTMKFLKELPIYDVEQPYKLHGFPELSPEQQTNCVFDEYEVTAEDVRDLPDKCNIEREGFEFMKIPTRCTMTADVFESESLDANNTVGDYIQETMDLVRERLDARFVVTIDWRVVFQHVGVSFVTKKTQFRRNDAAAFPQRLKAGEMRKQAIAVATTVHCGLLYLSNSGSLLS